jgi:hypothetical protein
MNKVTKGLSPEHRLLLCKQSLLDVYEKNGVTLKETMRKFTLSEINRAWRSLQGTELKHN